MVELVLQLLGAIAAEQARRPGPDQATAAAGRDRRGDRRRDRATGGDHGAGRHRRADVGEPADDPGPRLGERVIADEGGARHGRIVLQLLDLLIGVAELGLHRPLAGQQTELGAIEAGDHQLLDRGQERVPVVKDTDGLTNHLSLLWSFHRRSPNPRASAREVSRTGTCLAPVPPEAG